MSEEAKKAKLVQVTSVDVLLDNGMRVTWQGFRPANANKKQPTLYFTTLPNDGSGTTSVNLVEIGAQSPGTGTVTLSLLAGQAALNGTPLTPNDPQPVPGAKGGDGETLAFTSETCTIEVCPESAGGDVEGGNGGGNSPPPPYPGNR